MRTVSIALAGILAAGFAAQAQDYPTRDITTVVVWGAGGGTDTINRLLAAEMQKHLPVRINVVNRTGGVGGSAGMSYVFSQPTDGYTLAGISESNVTAGVQGGWDQRFDVWQPFIFGGSPLVLSVSANAPWQNLEELVEAARAAPGSIRAGASAAGSIHHLNLLAFERGTGTDFNYIPYDGSAPAQNAAVAGEVQVVLTSIAEQQQLIRAGRLRPLAMMTPDAMELEGVGEIASAFDAYPKLDEHLPIAQSIGVAVRADAPDEVKARLGEAFEAALQEEAVQNWARDNYYSISGKHGEEANEEFARLESLFAWTLHELGATTVDPETLGIPRPNGD
ncbi:Bug family tripartite tricarboxylate transporter substrate binding protein [Salinarimonas sp.]|uniref:Bug family tripartite tricarboxylate transporter substrate binding protein n=1 Tax=Salinarimonas sp. TaxID=2766526 RepID=UPI00391DB634